MSATLSACSSHLSYASALFSAFNFATSSVTIPSPPSVRRSPKILLRELGSLTPIRRRCYRVHRQRDSTAAERTEQMPILVQRAINQHVGFAALGVVIAAIIRIVFLCPMTGALRFIHQNASDFGSSFTLTAVTTTPADRTA